MAGLPALECCQKANRKLRSRRLKPLWNFSLLPNVLDSRRSGGSLKLRKTNRDWSWWLITRRQKAVQSLGEETIWSGLASVLRSGSKSRALLPYISWHQASLTPRARPSAANKRASLLFGAGWPISSGHPFSVSVTSIPSVSFISSLTCC